MLASTVIQTRTKVPVYYKEYYVLILYRHVLKYLCTTSSFNYILCINIIQTRAKVPVYYKEFNYIFCINIIQTRTKVPVYYKQF